MGGDPKGRMVALWAASFPSLDAQCRISRASRAVLQKALLSGFPIGASIGLDLPNGTRLHIIDVHLKSKIPTTFPARSLMPTTGGPPTREPSAPSFPR
jgi:hypothetical protein